MICKDTQGFRAVPIKFSKKCSSEHQIFIKAHSVRNESEDKPTNKTVFVINVPPWVTKDSFKRAFSCVGPVKNVIFQSKPSSKDCEDKTNPDGFKVAYVVFEKVGSVQKALALTNLDPLSTNDSPIVTGLQKWALEYNQQIYDHQQLEKTVNDFMLKYDKETERQKRLEKHNETGSWTVVTNKKRASTISRKVNSESKILAKTARNEKRKHLTDFYTFQKRESKMNHLAEMRRKYEEDKKKINAMKQARKFKPF